MSNEQREHVRHKVSRVEVRVASQEAFRASYLRDLSMGGLFVRSRQPLAEGTQVVVELAVESQPPVKLKGEVARQEHDADGTARGFGVRFSTVDPETRAALEIILAEHQVAPAGAADLETQLAEARGTLEAYEETAAQLRQSEADALHRAEAAQAECGVLVQASHELQSRVKELEQDRASLAERLAKAEAELKAARAQVAKSTSEREEAITRLKIQLEEETQRAATVKGQLDSEVRSLQEQLSGSDEARLRAELQDVSAKLDEERLKSMALQRFVEMSGKR